MLGNAAACRGMALSMAPHSMPGDALGLTGVEELMVALVPLEKADAATAQKEKVAYCNCC